jgi:hypothetical protein
MDVSQVIFACASHPQVTAANGTENALFARALRLIIKERKRAGDEADDKNFISKLQDNLNQATKELRDLSDAGVSIKSLLASCRIYGGFAAAGGAGAEVAVGPRQRAVLVREVAAGSCLLVGAVAVAQNVFAALDGPKSNVANPTLMTERPQPTPTTCKLFSAQSHA